MITKISGKNMEVGESLTAHIHEQMNKITEHYFQTQVDNSKVILSKHNNRFQVDITVHVTLNLVVHITDYGDDAYRCVDSAFHKLQTRLKRYKNRLKDRKRRSHETITDMLPASQYIMKPQEEDQEGDTPLIIAENQLDLPILTVSDAVMHMELSGQNILMFKNASNNQLNVVHMRDDGNIGWIDPTLPKA